MWIVSFKYILSFFLIFFSALSLKFIAQAEEVLIEDNTESFLIKEEFLVGTSTENFNHDFSSTTEEVETGELFEEEDIEIEQITEPAEIIEQVGPIFALKIIQPNIKRRELKNQVIFDEKAGHSCEVENFKVEISDKSVSYGKIILNKEASFLYELEIGGLPQGIDVVFIKNNSYKYTPNTNEKTVELEIKNSANSQKGDFNVPIIYIKKGEKDSFASCQINIVNK